MRQLCGPSAGPPELEQEAGDRDAEGGSADSQGGAPEPQEEGGDGRVTQAKRRRIVAEQRAERRARVGQLKVAESAAWRHELDRTAAADPCLDLEAAPCPPAIPGAPVAQGTGDVRWFRGLSGVRLSASLHKREAR